MTLCPCQGTLIAFKRRIRRQVVGAGSRDQDEEAGSPSVGGSVAPAALVCGAQGLCAQGGCEDGSSQQEGGALLAFRDVVEDEDEDQDSDVDVDNGDLPVYAQSLPAAAAAAAGEARKGKRKRVVDWEGKHACVGVGGSLSASIKGLRSLGRMGSRSAADGTGAALMPRSECESTVQGAATAAALGERVTAKPGGGSGLTRLLDDLNRVSQDVAPDLGP